MTRTTTSVARSRTYFVTCFMERTRFMRLRVDRAHVFRASRTINFAGRTFSVSVEVSPGLIAAVKRFVSAIARCKFINIKLCTLNAEREKMRRCFGNCLQTEFPLPPPPREKHYSKT